MKAIIAFLILVGSSTTWANDITVTQKDKAFNTKKIKAKIGDKILFKNDEKDITHNVFSLSTGNEFELKTQRPGETSIVELTGDKHKPGVMEVECAIHPDMKLTIEIEK